jgi:hypothetical protein
VPAGVLDLLDDGVDVAHYVIHDDGGALGLVGADDLGERSDVWVEQVLGLIEQPFGFHALGSNGEPGDFEGLAEEVDVVLGVADDLLPESFDLLGQGLVDGVRQDALVNFLRQPVSGLGVLLGIGLLGVTIALDQTGHGEAAITLVVTTLLGSLLIAVLAHHQRNGITVAAEKAAPQGPIRIHTIQEVIKLRHSPSKVWSLIVPAEHAPLLSPTISRAYQVPGTPKGVGEQQASTDLAGNTAVVEIIEYVEERRAVTKVVSPPMPVPIRMTYSLEPLGEGCLFAYSQEYEAASNQVRSDDDIRAWREYAQDYLGRVRSVLDNGFE